MANIDMHVAIAGAGKHTQVANDRMSLNNI